MTVLTDAVTGSVAPRRHADRAQHVPARVVPAVPVRQPAGHRVRPAPRRAPRPRVRGRGPGRQLRVGAHAPAAGARGGEGHARGRGRRGRALRVPQPPGAGAAVAGPGQADGGGGGAPPDPGARAGRVGRGLRRRGRGLAAEGRRQPGDPRRGDGRRGPPPRLLPPRGHGPREGAGADGRHPGHLLGHDVVPRADDGLPGGAQCQAGPARVLAKLSAQLRGGRPRRLRGGRLDLAARRRRRVQGGDALREVLVDDGEPRHRGQGPRLRTPQDSKKHPRAQRRAEEEDGRHLPDAGAAPVHLPVRQGLRRRRRLRGVRGGRRRAAAARPLPDKLSPSPSVCFYCLMFLL